MTVFRISVGALLLGASAIGAAAQNLSTGYFNDGYLYRHTMNPAISNEQSYVSIPALGNVGVSMRGNVGLGDFLYVRNGKTVTFMHPSVGTEEAIKPFKDKNQLNLNVREEILSIGIAHKGGRGYSTLGISARANATVGLPGQLLRLAKEGPANKTYDLSAISGHADAFAEIALGHSHKVGQCFEVGGKLKFLLGMGNVDLEAKEMRMTLSEDVWTAVSDAEVQTSIKGASYDIDEDGRMEGIELDGFGLNGFGLAFDLGATYKYKDLTVGLAVIDLGFISWSNNMVASTNGPKSVSTDNFIFSADDDADNSFESEFDRLGDAVADLYKLQNMGDQGSRTRALGATLNASAEYAMPFYRKLSVGLLSTTRLQGSNTWTEARLSANVAPVKWFAASVSGAVGTFGPSFGGMISLHPRGFNIFAGVDCIPTFSKQGVPVGHGMQVNMGLNIPF